MWCLRFSCQRLKRRARRRRNKLTVPYKPGAACPLFLDTLLRPLLEAEDLDLLQRWCGLALVGVNLAPRFVILTGTAGSGKGTSSGWQRARLGGDGEAEVLHHHLRHRHAAVRADGPA